MNVARRPRDEQQTREESDSCSDAQAHTTSSGGSVKIPKDICACRRPGLDVENRKL